MTHNMKIIGGLDIGNGYQKSALVNVERGTRSLVDIPSAVRMVTHVNQTPLPDEEAPMMMGNGFFNELDASFDSPMIADTHRRLFGVRALSAEGVFEEFEVTADLSKAQQQLSKLLLLGAFASKALIDYVGEHGALPQAETVVSVDARASLALPIDEFKNFRHEYAGQITSGTHRVTIHNFETPMTVEIVFTDVPVIAEGAPAQYAIMDKGVPLMEAMLADARSRGMSSEGITGADVLEAKNTVGIDVGEGTVNFPVFTNGRFNADASRSFDKGFGSVLSNALEAMRTDGFKAGFNSRKQLGEFLLTEPSAMKRAFYGRVRTYVDKEIEFFCRDVVKHYGKILQLVGATTEVTYIYGGGAQAIKDVLYPAVATKVTEIIGEDAMALLYLDAAYSRNLNREGLLIMATARAARDGYLGR